MTDIESMLLNDIPYLSALDSSETAARALYKKYALPDISVHSVVTFYLKDHGQLKFKYVYQDVIGRHYFSLFCGSRYQLLNFLQEIYRYENTTMDHKRETISHQIVDTYIMPDLLANTSLFQKEVTDKVVESLNNGMVTPTLFREIKRNLMLLLEGSKFKEFLKSPEFARYCQWKHIELNIPFSMNINDFTILRIIGRGGFGEVYGCRKNDTGKLFALKCSDKRRIKLKRCESVAFNERDILSRLSSPFIVNLHYCFQSATTVYHVLDLMNGGDLQFYLNKYGMFADKVARFYMCEIILGLQHLHDNNIVHRDIKAPNILLDEHGHVKISDFGLAWNYLVKKTSLKVGTVGFMAPEVMKREHYTFTADWYSFGCLCCQLVNCDIPFKSSRSSDKPPEHLSVEMLQLIRGLLKEDPKQRLGCRGRGANELKECAFFKEIDWDDAADKKLKPPLIPSKTQVNTANLTSTPNGLNDHDIKDIELTEQDKVMYGDFSRVVSTQWQNEIIGSLFDTVNVVHDKLEAKERQKLSKTRVDYYSPSLTRSDCMLQGIGQKLTTTVRVQHWQRKYFRLYPNRLEWADGYMQLSKSAVAMLPFDGPLLIREISVKDTKHIVIQKIGERQEYQLKFESGIDHMMWLKLLQETSQTASQNMSNSGILTQLAFNSNFIAMRRHRLALKESRSLPFASTL